MRTVWNGAYSDAFTTINGIRQGSVISPMLFCVYMDELLLRLKANNIGCCIGNKYLGGLGYADDLTLLCPSVKGLQEMLKTCELYGDEYGTQYNPTKSVCVLFQRGDRIKPPDIHLAQRKLQWVSSVKHLGNWITSDLSEQKEINVKKADMIYRVNTVSANFGRQQ